MSVTLELLDNITNGSPSEAWASVSRRAWDVCSQPIRNGDPAAEIRSRDQALETVDLLLSHACWDLWSHLEASLPSTAARSAAWWEQHSPGRAVLILDGLSLREAPWVLAGAAQHGFAVADSGAFRAELPADTVYCAKALGWNTRSALANGVASTYFPGARSESLDTPFEDCAGSIGSEPDWVFWHHWPDHRLHELSEAGKGLPPLIAETKARLCGDEFWHFVARLAEGRRVLLTSDHGYAAAGYFSDAGPTETEHLKTLFKSGRHAPGKAPPSQWLPPLAVSLESRWGEHSYALGRRKWKSAGGYPTLTHGGLTVLEVLTPYFELERV